MFFTLKIMKIVTFGGGTGHHQLAKALKRLSKEKNIEVNFVVGTWDNGGSSKYLRIGEKLLPPGDLGNVYSALSNLEEEELRIIWDGRINLAQESKHTPRNLIIANAIKEYKDDWEKINRTIKKLLDIEDSFFVYPITKRASSLVASFEKNNKIYFIEGEEEIDFYILKEKREPLDLYLKEDQDVYPLKKIMESDLVLIAPGSFYTSIYPHFLFEEINKIIKEKRKILIANIFTQGDINYQLEKLYNKIGSFEVLYNNKEISKKEKEHYLKKEWKSFVEENKIKEFCKNYGLNCHGFDLLYKKDPGKHDENKLYKALKELLNYSI